jgi:hypothetical protein
VLRSCKATLDSFEDSSTEISTASTAAMIEYEKYFYEIDIGAFSPMIKCVAICLKQELK